MQADPAASTPSCAGGWSNAEAYLSLIERGRKSIWRTVAGCLLIVASWIGLGSLLYVLYQDMMVPGSAHEFIGTNLSILVMLIGLAAAVLWLQRRPLITLITTRSQFDWYRVWQGFAVLFAITGVSLAIECLLYPGRYTFNTDSTRLLLFVPLVLMLTPLQAATEELVFRGFLMQSLRSFTRSPVLIIIVSSVIFMVPHLWNPEAEHGMLIIVQYVLIGAFFAVITLRDGRLELAIGAHAAINIFIALVAAYPDSALNTPALLIADILDPLYSLASLILGSAAFYWWFFLRRAS